MRKKGLIYTLKKLVLRVFQEKKEESERWREKMREELQRMAKLNGELILMMK